jgi:hypothetical protein
MEKMDRLKLVVSIVFKVFLLVAIVISIFQRNWFSLTISTLTLALSYLPSILQKRLKVEYPSEFELMIVIFLFCALYLGEVRNFYEKFWWWDTVLHTSSGILLGFFGFTLVYTINKETQSIYLSPIFIAIFSFTFAVAFGGLWEIFEYNVDKYLGANMQRAETGVIDTMQDLIVDTIGAFTISIASYFYLKNTDHNKDPKFYSLNRLTHKFMKKNPHLFKKK